MTEMLGLSSEVAGKRIAETTRSEEKNKMDLGPRLLSLIDKSLKNSNDLDSPSVPTKSPPIAMEEDTESASDEMASFQSLFESVNFSRRQNDFSSFNAQEAKPHYEIIFSGGEQVLLLGIYGLILILGLVSNAAMIWVILAMEDVIVDLQNVVAEYLTAQVTEEEQERVELYLLTQEQRVRDMRAEVQDHLTAREDETTTQFGSAQDDLRQFQSQCRSEAVQVEARTRQAVQVAEEILTNAQASAHNAQSEHSRARERMEALELGERACDFEDSPCERALVPGTAQNWMQNPAMFHGPGTSRGPIVDGLVISKLRYGLPVFGQVRLQDTDPTHGNMKKLQGVLNDLMRLVANKRISDKISCVDQSEMTGIPSLNRICASATLKESKRASDLGWPLVDVLEPAKTCYGMGLRSQTSKLARANILVSAFTITVIAVDRWKSVSNTNPNTVLTYKSVFGIIAVIWMLSFLVTSPLLIYQTVNRMLMPTTDIILMQVCTEQFPKDFYKHGFTVAILIVQYVVPLMVLPIVHAKILLFLRRNSGFQTDPRRREREERRNRRMTLVLSCIGVIYAISWMPLHLYLILTDFFSLLQIEKLDLSFSAHPDEEEDLTAHNYNRRKSSCQVVSRRLSPSCQLLKPEGPSRRESGSFVSRPNSSVDLRKSANELCPEMHQVVSIEAPSSTGGNHLKPPDKTTMDTIIDEKNGNSIIIVTKPPPETATQV
eukprot:maker-scaffold326_size205590-snap-gene-1.12 protein:Tk02475 transcript:maker-scaffold326_size205590-snap-gene-1.12-mRNA-1 annotation:"neuropeptide gpcr a38"